MSVTIETTTAPYAGDLEELRARITGEVYSPGEPGYEQARLAWNTAVEQHPALIVAARSAADVVEAVCFAGQAGMGVAVQGTGHGLKQPANGALLIQTAGLSMLKIDAEEQTAWIGAGLKWGAVLEQAQQVGLAPLLGSTTDVGVIGYTLGGGLGWLGRKYGLALDSVLAFELVTAQGELITASAEQHADLFWGLRGGGAGLAVITAMKMRLYPVQVVYAGNLLYPIEMAKEVMQRYRAWAQSAPDELTSSVVLMNYPPLDVVPEPLRGKSFVMVRGAYCGSLEEGEAMLRYWREWRAPALDMFGPLPFSQADLISNDPKDPMGDVTSGVWMDGMPDEAIDTLIQYTVPQAGPPMVLLTEVRHAGGIIARQPVESAAYSNRSGEFLVFSLALVFAPEQIAGVRGHIRAMQAVLSPWLSGGAYLNFLGMDEVQKRLGEVFSAAALEKLRAIKAQYDPFNLFRYGLKLTE